MKVFPLVFSLYILGLSCIPCSDNAVCQEEPVAINLSSPDHEDHQHKMDLCSPFCICICCGLTFTQHNVHSFTTSNINILHPNFEETPELIIPGVYFSIWQPPRIS